MSSAQFQVGDWVIFKKSKQSVRPGPRAHDVKPFEKGEGYSYVVDKFWVVTELLDDGTLVLKTRRGKEHHVRPDDPRLRKANWWQRRRHRRRFEEIESGSARES